MLRPLSTALLLPLLSTCTLLFSPSDDTSGAAGDDAAPIDATFVDGTLADGTTPTDWSESDFNARLRIPVTNPTNQELVDFPVLLPIEIQQLNEYPSQGLNRIHLRRDDSGENVAFDREPFNSEDPTTDINIWFSATLPANSTVNFTLYFDSQLPDTARSTTVWQSYLSVWHLSDVGTNSLLDSAQAGHDGNTDSTNFTAGSVGSGVSVKAGFNTVSTIGNPLKVSAGNTHACISISGWVKPRKTSANIDLSLARSLLSTDVDSFGGYRLSYVGPGYIGPHAVLANQQGGQPQVQIPIYAPAASLPNNITPPGTKSNPIVSEWHWLAMTLADDSLKYHLDGVVMATVLMLDSPKFGDSSAHIGKNLAGSIDELRVSVECRSDVWMKAEYLSVAMPFASIETIEIKPDSRLHLLGSDNMH